MTLTSSSERGSCIERLFEKYTRPIIRNGTRATLTRTLILGSGCGSVGRAVASDTRGPRFKSSHRQKFIYIEHLLTVNCVLKRRK